MTELVRGEDDWSYFNRYRGARTFYRGYTKSVVDQIIASPAVVRRITEIAEKKGVKKAVIKAQATKQATNFVAHHEYQTFIRFSSWMVGSILKSVYDQGVWVDTAEIRRLRETARICAEKRQSIIFLPCHRSHVDYISLQLLYFQLGLSLPCIVAGENLNFPLVGPFLQNAGAFWIKRENPNGEADPLYTPLMASYIDVIMDRGLNFEVFLEGGRSRTGKMLPPKFGMLKAVCDSLLRLDKDAIIIPVSIQYDNVLETESYANELLGRPKTKESLASFFQARKVLGLRMGRIDARFAEGFSVREWMQKNASSIAEGKEVTDVEAFAQNPARMLRALGYKVLNDINDASVVMPTALLGTVLLTIRGRGVGKKELIRRVAWLSDKIRGKGGRVASIDDYETVIDKAINVLGSLVGIRKDLLEDTYYAADRFQISYFRNQIIHLFISEAIICVTLYAKVKAGGRLTDQRMTAEELEKQTKFLSQVMKGEFIYNASGIETNIQSALTQLESDGVIVIGDGYIELSASERLSGREHYDFYCFLLWPFVETYWFAGVCLFALTPLPNSTTPSNSVNIKDFEKATQALGKTLYFQGDLSYMTAISNDTLINALEFYTSVGITRVIKGPRKRDNRVEFTPEWQPERNADGRLERRGRLWNMVEGIAICRREGKNRRDSATVESRVLDMVDTVSLGLVRGEIEPPKPFLGRGKKAKKAKL